MNNSSITGLAQNATWRTMGEQGLPLHFYHANGFSSGVYLPLLERLSDSYRVSALDMRPTWGGAASPPRSRSWMPYADDLIAYLEAEHKEPVIGVGHSMAAIATVYAAEKRPDLFKALVIIEPAMITPVQNVIANLLPKAIMNRVEPAKTTLAKRDIWPDRGAFKADCRTNKAFRRFTEEALDAMVAHGVKERPDGQVELAFPKKWEAHNYTAPPAAMKNLLRIKHPCAAIFGRPSIFFSKAMVESWQARRPDLIVRHDQRYGHLFPIEAPKDCFALLQEVLAGLPS